MTARATATKLATSVSFLWIVIAALGALALLATFRRPPAPLIPPETRALIDSLRATKQRDASTIDSLRSSSAKAQARGQGAIETARGVVTRSTVDRYLADSLAVQALKTDSTAKQAELYRLAYQARSREADSLRRAFALADSAHRSDSLAIALLKGAAVVSDARAVKLEQLNAQLEDVAKKAERGCRVLWMRCPSRTEAAIGGVVVGAATREVISILTNR